MAYHTVGILLAFTAATLAAQVPVTVYYESLCPDSAKFITQQLYPAVSEELKDHVAITWVPFGKSNYRTQGSEIIFECHHGKNECYGNKIHACAIEHIQTNSFQNEFTRDGLILRFINCMMSRGKNFPDEPLAVDNCARESQVAIPHQIKQCANSTEGNDLLKKHGDTTWLFQKPITSVPTIVFNQQYDEREDKLAQQSFVAAVCKYLPMQQVRICQTHNAGAAIARMPILGLIIFAVARLF